MPGDLTPNMCDVKNEIFLYRNSDGNYNGNPQKADKAAYLIELFGCQMLEPFTFDIRE